MPAAAAVDAHFAAAGERRSLATSLGAWTGSAPRRGAGILTEVYYLARREKNSLLRDRAGLVAAIALSFPNESEAEGVRAD